MILVFALGIVSFLLALVITPLVRNQFQNTAFVDQPDHGRKIHSTPVPRVGGISLVVSYLLAFVIISLIPFQTWGFTKLSFAFGQALFLGSVVVFLSGLLDDFLNIRPWQKLAAQLVASLIIYQSGIRIHLPGEWPYSEFLSLLATIAWLVACTNAFNLIDGMDGLAAGIGLFATVTMLVAALLNNNVDLMIVTVPLAGSLLGFLRYNFNPASIFLGDCGSMLIGFLLGCFAIEWSHKSVTMLGLTAPMMAMAIPLLDAFLSICRRFLRNRPIFGADRGHIHHRLLDLGLTQKQAAIVAYGLSGLAAAFSLVQNALHQDFGGLIILLFGLMVWIGIQNLGYVEFGMASRMLFRGTFGRIVDFQTHLRNFEQAMQKAESEIEIWDEVRKASKHFGFHGSRLHLLGNVHTDIEPGYQNSMQIRIPLAQDNYVNFYGIDGQLHSVVLNTFLPTVANALNTKIASLGKIAAVPKSVSPAEVVAAKPKLVKLA
ncbi:MraY family glycosyltransferase [Oscillatoria amoena NRMC-F 0135]|nr:MraY family glycosyltransferase [Oscillatoria amoena NRMC-F 0135]